MKDPNKLTFNQARSEFTNVDNFIDEAERMLVLTGLYWHDVSWHNDVCPHVVSVSGGLPLMLWFDSDEESEAGYKLSLYVWYHPVASTLNSELHTIYAGNSWLELLENLKDVLENERLPPVPGGLDLAAGYRSESQALAEAREWVKQLVIRNMAFHFDDDPFDQVKTGTGGEKAFTRIQAASLAATVELFREYKVDLCTMYFQALADMGLYGDCDGSGSEDNNAGVLSLDYAVKRRLNPPKPVSLAGTVIVDDEHLLQDLPTAASNKWTMRAGSDRYYIEALGDGTFNVWQLADVSKVAMLNDKPLSGVTFRMVMEFVQAKTDH